MFKGFNLDKTYQFLLIALAFLMPLTVFGANLVILLILLIWLLTGDYLNKFNQIFNSKLLLSSLIFFAIHVAGLFWTQDLEWGIHIVRKMWYFVLLFPILYTIVKKNNIHLYIAAFLFAISITELLSYLVWFELIEPFRHATINNPTPFMSHVSYNPILAFAIYLVLHRICILKNLDRFQVYLYSFFAITMTINMFITGGRAGQVVYFVMLLVLCFQIFRLNKIKALLVSLALIPVVFFTAYQSSDLFKDRVDEGYINIVNYSQNKQTSIGYRISFTINSFQIINSNPLIGVGTGDFPSEYKLVNQINTPELPNTTNPHNMYILILVQLGCLGLISMAFIFYYQLEFSRYSKDRFVRDVGFFLPVLFLVIMMSDSYLLGHFTSLVFIFFSSFLYKDFEKN
jgi:O-antigen ligase